MIEIKDKALCCGCEACVQVCPKNCIRFTQDSEGFNYPEVDTKKCVDCGLCDKVCPVINQSEKRTPSAVYAAKNLNDKIRKESSSGGVFSLIAERTISRGGVVFGARWNDSWDVVHDYVETIEDVALFRGSKYVQSRIGESYKKVFEFLKNDREVLFSGTPCQVAGLKRFLRKDYEKLLTIDFICHGVPSPKVWQEYLKELVKKKNIGVIKSINFRDKRKGWYNYMFSIEGECKSFSEASSCNLYMRGFLKDLYIRPSCHDCPSKSLKSGSDITIGDFWGVKHIHPEFYDNCGTSLVIINNSKGKATYSSLELSYIVSDVSAFKHNPSIYTSPKIHIKRNDLFIQLINNKSIMSSIKTITKDPIILRTKIILGKVKRYILNQD